MTSQSLRDRLIEATGGRYIVDDELGRGGMAVVFAAMDARLKRPVAIKALPPELAFRGDVRSRFLREAQMAAALSHQHIVPIYAVEEFEGLVYMVMGLVRGESLAQRLHREKRLSFVDARRILRETADALAHAHAHGVIHRDIKPDNILLDAKSGRVLVTDFGIARALEGDARLTATGVAVGTPTYMSPEQARGDDDVDGRADVYALGVVGFQALAGEPPFNAPNTPALLLKHVSEPPPAVAARRPDVPAPLAYAIDRALAKDRASRWATASAMYDALADDARGPSLVPGLIPKLSAPLVNPWTAPPPLVAGEWKLPRPESPASSDPRPSNALPPYPAYKSGTDKEEWRVAQRKWRERVSAAAHAHQQEWDAEKRARKEARNEGIREHAHGLRARKKRSLADRIRSFQVHVVSNVVVMFVLFVLNAATGGFPWFLFPAFGMLIGIMAHALTLWQDGVRTRDLFRRPSQLAELAAPQYAVLDPVADADARARALVGSEVLAGLHGAHVRHAMDDERAIQEILRSLLPADRAQLPDVEPTLRALIDRVASLAQSAHRLDADVRPEQIVQIERRLAEARAMPEGAAERERRMILLERQLATMTELADRRIVIVDQLESAALVLHTMRLDLLRLRSAGIGNAVSDVNNATQEARALSADIGRVLDAASEVRKL